MERLTVKRNGVWHFEDWERGIDCTGKAIDRLAAYEDTGLEPEEIAKLQLAYEAMPKGVTTSVVYDTCFGVPLEKIKKLLSADKDGRLVVLPCKAGDTVWKTKAVFSNYQEPRKETVCGFAYPWHDPSGDELLICCNGGYKFSEKQVGDTVFLTRAEAEAALRGEEDAKP